MWMIFLTGYLYLLNLCQNETLKFVFSIAGLELLISGLGNHRLNNNAKNLVGLLHNDLLDRHKQKD